LAHSWRNLLDLPPYRIDILALASQGKMQICPGFRVPRLLWMPHGSQFHAGVIELSSR
jgi:hypothetical protein